MTAKFKHRLLGTTILVLAGIIFLPDLLDGEKQIVKDDFKVIPDRPEFQDVKPMQTFDEEDFAIRAQQLALQAVEDETPLDSNEPVSEGEKLPSQNYAQVTVGGETSQQSAAPETTVSASLSASTTSTVSPTTAAPTAVVATPVPSQAAWVVRVGSFSNQQNANALVTKLRQAGFATFTRNIINSNGQRLTSVFVGPELRRDRLEQGLPKLQQLTGIERLVISNYQPTENN